MRARLGHRAATGVLCFGVFVAQTSAHATAVAGQASETRQADSKPTTIVGCLVQGLPGSTTATGGVEAATARDYFIRTPTMKIPAGATVAVGAPGTTSTATSIGTPVEDSFYRVSGLAEDLLRPHVGHRVEMQGKLTGNTPGIESTKAMTTQDKDGRATTKVETRIAIAGVLHATAVKMLSATCK
jgi:hypothetical protein